MSIIHTFADFSTKSKPKQVSCVKYCSESYWDRIARKFMMALKKYVRENNINEDKTMTMAYAYKFITGSPEFDLTQLLTLDYILQNFIEIENDNDLDSLKHYVETILIETFGHKLANKRENISENIYKFCEMYTTVCKSQ